MIDLHSHILPGIDDGARDSEETFRMLMEANEAGFTNIISTSHYYLGYFEHNEKTRKEYIEGINNKLKENGFDLQINIGSEIYFTSDIVDLLIEHKASSINNTRYLLFELPFLTKPQNLKDIIYSLLSHQYIPILAHPERYKYVQKDPNMLLELFDLGVLFQSNFGSIIGQYGKIAEKTVKLLLKNNFIHFLGTDAHRKNSIYTAIPTAIDSLKEIITEEQLEKITTINPNLVLENKDINTKRPIKIKKRSFWTFTSCQLGRF